MNGIVPLAGPDFEQAGHVKAERLVDGMPLLRHALESRPWWRSGALTAEKMIFILRDTQISRCFADNKLKSWYPGAHHVFLSETASGAALSAVAGTALLGSWDEPLIIDLCDILFRCDVDPDAVFAQNLRLGGLAIIFESQSPLYSYLELDDAGCMVRAREKSVISSHASAGVYWFRSPAVFLRALAHSIENRAELSYNGLLYLCPMLNGVIAAGLQVKAASAFDVVDVR